MADAAEARLGDRGQGANWPGQIPRPGWRDIFVRVKNSLAEDNLSIVAAGVAFYALLAIFPALFALVSVYGLISNPADVQSQLQNLGGVLPAEARDLLTGQLKSVASGASGALGLGAAVGILLALWSAASGVKTLMTALDIVYDEEEKRGFFRFNLMALALTLGAIVMVVLSIALIVALPAVLGIFDNLLGSLGIGEVAQTLVTWLRWPLLAVAVILALAILYRYGPSRAAARWRWVSWGALLATLLWLVASALFSFYVANFGSYNETYGSVGAIVILLMWLYITAYVLLLGAELNAEMEYQTARDTTTGRPRPLGRRGARVADTVAH